LEPLTNTRFGKWTFLRPAGKDASGKPLAGVICDCGTEANIVLNNLVKGLSQSCGCQRRNPKKYMGERHGKLEIVSEPSGQGNHRMVDTLCECGTTSRQNLYAIRSGNTTSCGCYRLEVRTKHGLHGTKTYRAWAGMLCRVRLANAPNFHHYGGRGISVSEDWKLFNNFVRDMGEAPEGLTLERLDNDGNYCKENCVWASKSTQAENKDRKGSRKIGVNPTKDGRWKATIILDTLEPTPSASIAGVRTKTLGLFTSYEEAVQARIAAENFYRPKENHDKQD